jgi:hypothetical protein
VTAAAAAGALRTVGFFRELVGTPSDSDQPSIHDAVGRLDAAYVPAFHAYLTGAPVLGWFSMIAQDELEATRPDIGPLALHTDGTWVWRSDLAYYVERYAVAVPVELLGHLAARGWIPPTEDELDLAALLPYREMPPPPGA